MQTSKPPLLLQSRPAPPPALQQHTVLPLPASAPQPTHLRVIDIPNGPIRLVNLPHSQVVVELQQSAAQLGTQGLHTGEAAGVGGVGG